MTSPQKTRPARTRSLRRTGLLSAVVLATIAGSVTAAVADTGARAAIADAQPSWATAAADHGPADQATALDARVYLASQNPAALRAFDTAVSTPGTADYGHYLSPAQYWSRFGPTTAQTSAVESWLRSEGLTVTGANQHYVSVHGSIATAEQAFGTAIHDFTDHGAAYYAPAGQVTVPSSVASDVLSVTGLDNAPHQAKPDDTLPGPAPAIFRATPCSTYYGQNPATTEPKVNGTTAAWTNCGYTPQQIRSAYNLTYAPTGQGETVAIMLAYASPTIVSDVTQYTANHGTADFRQGQFTQNLPSSWNSTSACAAPSWYSEESMDVDALHDVAPDANVTYVAAASCNDTDLEDAESRIVDNKLATIVSDSWTDGPEGGEDAADRSAFDQIFQQGVAEGIGFYFGAGDCGDNDQSAPCGLSGGPGPNFPPSDPWVTGVGGTTMEVGADGKQVFQTGWGDVKSTLTSDGTGWTPAPGSNFPAGFDGGSGGGTSQYYAQPSYQASVVPTSLSETLLTGTTESSPMRVSPDISMDADNNTGLLVGETQTFPDGSVKYAETRWGGTSLATPLMAGLQALAQQMQGKTIGFANPALYKLYDTSWIQNVTDTPEGANTWLGVVRNDYATRTDPTSAVTTRLWTFGHDGPLHATGGYSDETGIGTPSTSYVDAYCCQVGGTARH